MFNEYLTKEAREYNGVKTVSSINGFGNNWTGICPEVELLEQKGVPFLIF